MSYRDQPLNQTPPPHPPRRAQQRRLCDQHIHLRPRHRQLRRAIALVGHQYVDRRAQAEAIFRPHALQRQIGRLQPLRAGRQPPLRGGQRGPSGIRGPHHAPCHGIRVEPLRPPRRLRLPHARGDEAAGQQGDTQRQPRIGRAVEAVRLPPPIARRDHSLRPDRSPASGRPVPGRSVRWPHPPGVAGRAAADCRTPPPPAHRPMCAARRRAFRSSRPARPHRARPSRDTPPLRQRPPLRID